MYLRRAVFVFVLVLRSVELSVQLPSQGGGQGIPHKLDDLLTAIKKVAGSEERIEPLLDEKLDALKDSINNDIMSTLDDSFSDFTSAFSAFSAKLSQCCVPKTTVPPSTTTAPISGSDCADLRRQGTTQDGVYTVTPKKRKPFDVYCDMTTDGGGWTVFQKRFNGSVDFYLDWAAYKKGFGDLRGEFWLGNDKIHILTTQEQYELRVDLMDVHNVTKYAVYDAFKISSESDKYRLSLGSYNGTAGPPKDLAGDAMGINNGMAFSTKDRDNDRSVASCAVSNTGAWWYQSCHFANLNGQYSLGHEDMKYMTWRHFHGLFYGLRRSEMKIRPVDFQKS